MEVWNYSSSVSLTIASNDVILTYLGASNCTGNYLLKVLICNSCYTVLLIIVLLQYYHNDVLALVEEYEYSHPVEIIRQAGDHIYVATTTNVSG